MELLSKFQRDSKRLLGSFPLFAFVSGYFGTFSNTSFYLGIGRGNNIMKKSAFRQFYKLHQFIGPRSNVFAKRNRLRRYGQYENQHNSRAYRHIGEGVDTEGEAVKAETLLVIVASNEHHVLLEDLHLRDHLKTSTRADRQNASHLSKTAVKIQSFHFAYTPS